LELAAYIDMDFREFWEITPAELNIKAEAYGKRREEEQKESIYQAYLISRWVWEKKLDIEKILKPKKPKKLISAKHMLNQVKMLNAVFGGDLQR